MLIDIKRKVCLEQELLFQLMLVRMWQTNKKTENDKVYLCRKPLLPIWYSSSCYPPRKLQKSFENPCEKWTLANTINSNTISISRYEFFFIHCTFCLKRGCRVKGKWKWQGFIFMILILWDFEKNCRDWKKVSLKMWMRVFRDCRQRTDEKTGDWGLMYKGSL